jgi:outer membrane protein assembly factor BamB
VHDLVAIDARTGEIVWSFASPSGRQVLMGGLALGTVFAVSEDASVYALDAATGAVRWTHAKQWGFPGRLYSHRDARVN